jgi:hypothetical protein
MTFLRFIPVCALALAGACTSAARGPGMQDVAVQSVTISAPVGRVQQQERVIVRRAAIEIEVEEVAPAIERATRLAQAFEGYVENTVTREDKHAYLRLRVPSSRLTEALDSLARLGKVTGRSFSEDDVTAQSVDLEARVASFRAARDKLRELMDRAVTVADAVAAQGELARVQAELDSLEGQLRTIQSSVALSELTVTLNRRVVLGPLGLIASGLATLIGKLFVWR